MALARKEKVPGPNPCLDFFPELRKFWPLSTNELSVDKSKLNAFEKKMSQDYL